MANSAVDLKIPAIEKELTTLWKAALGKKQQRACLFTLIIYAQEARRVQYLQELVDSILDKFPCRIIFIKADAQASHPYFTVDVSTVLLGNIQQKSTVGCDRITIETSKDQLMRVPSLVTSHIVPDLPVYLLWGQNPFEENLVFPHLQNLSSRVIFDSECSDNLNLFTSEMLNNLKTLKIEVIDINWAVVSNWRDLLSQLFFTPEKVEALRNCKAIDICYNRSETDTVQHPEIRAIYLQGWLATQLKWKTAGSSKQNQSLVIDYQGPSHPIQVKITPQTYENLPPGGIASLEICLNDGHTYSLLRKPDLSQVVVHASSEIECQLPFALPLANVHRGMTFLKEIFYQPLGDHYRAMLQTISKIAEPLF